MAKNANASLAVSFLAKLGLEVTEVVQAKDKLFVGHVASSYNDARAKVKALGRACDRSFTKGVRSRTQAIINKKGEQALVTIKTDTRRPRGDRPVTVEISAVTQ